MQTPRFYKLLMIAMVLSFIPAFDAMAKIDLVTLSDRLSVQATIYNQADLTLVRDKRVMRFVKGMNRLQFSWANTKIDPTSLSIDIKNQADKIEIVEIAYPPGTKDVGIWRIKADQACQVPVEITYFTSGISWKSYYVTQLSEDQKTCSLTGFVTVTNASGEDYNNALTRLVVGKVNILDKIADLASRPYPYGRPEQVTGGQALKSLYKKGVRELEIAQPMMTMDSATAAPRQKKISKEGLSEYFIYTIDGEETLSHGWAKRLLSFEAKQIPVNRIFKYDLQRFGNTVVRFLSFKNDKKNHLGETPLPGGEIKVFHRVGKNGELDFLGSDTTKYIQVEQKVELNLGSTLNVKIVPTVMAYAKKNIIFDKTGNISGFDEIKEIEIALSNFTDTSAAIEYSKHLDSPHFSITDMTHPDSFEKTDPDTIRFTLDLAPHSNKSIRFTQTILRGERRWQP